MNMATEYNPTPEQLKADIAVWQVQMAEYIAKRDAAMQEAGVKVGDKVEYHVVSPFGSAEVFDGVLYIAKNGQPRVRLSGSRQSKGWNKGWTKVTVR
jgi:hypothetical protein